MSNSKAFIYNNLQTGRPARVALGVQYSSTNCPRWNSFASSERSLFLPNPVRSLFKRQFRHRLTIFSGVRSPVIHSRRRIPHNRLPPAHTAGKCPFHLDLVAFARQFVPHILPKAILHHHVATAERVF